MQIKVWVVEVANSRSPERRGGEAIDNSAWLLFLQQADSVATMQLAPSSCAAAAALCNCLHPSWHFLHPALPLSHANRLTHSIPQHCCTVSLAYLSITGVSLEASPAPLDHLTFRPLGGLGLSRCVGWDWVVTWWWWADRQLVGKWWAETKATGPPTQNHSSPPIKPGAQLGCETYVHQRGRVS